MDEVQVNKEVEIEPANNVDVDAVIQIDYNAPQFDIDRAVAHIRQALAGEEKTIAEYMEFANDVNEWFPTLAITFREIADEEKVHVGELKAMLKRFEDDRAFMAQGEEEVASIEAKFAGAKAIETIERMLAELEENEEFTNKSDMYKHIIEQLIKE